MKPGYWWVVIVVMALTATLIGAALYRNTLPPATESLVAVKPSQPVKEPAVQKEAPLPPVPAKVNVPILMYHYIRDYTDPNDPLGIQLSVSPSTFDKQLATLATAGYETISLEDFVAKRYKPKSIILTFDDGYDDHYTAAWPLLKKYHDTATFFIVSGFVNRTRYMTKDQIQQLKDAGMEIGGHTVDHKNLATMPYDKAIEEVFLSMTGRDPVFAYPSGQYNIETLDIVSALGNQAAVTTNLGIATEESPLFELPRIRVKEQTDLLKVIAEETAIAKHQLPPSQRSSN